MAWQKVSEERSKRESTRQAGKEIPGEGKCKRSREMATVRLSPAQGRECSQQDAGDGHSSPGTSWPPLVLTTISF